MSNNISGKEKLGMQLSQKQEIDMNFDKTFFCKILKNSIGVSDTLTETEKATLTDCDEFYYYVKIYGKFYKIKCADSSFIIDEDVRVKIPNNNWNRMYIDFKKASKINPVTNFVVERTDDNKIKISWNNPKGDFTGVIIQKSRSYINQYDYTPTWTVLKNEASVIIEAYPPQYTSNITYYYKINSFKIDKNNKYIYSDSLYSWLDLYPELSRVILYDCNSEYSKSSHIIGGLVSLNPFYFNNNPYYSDPYPSVNLMQARLYSAYSLSSEGYQPYIAEYGLSQISTHLQIPFQNYKDYKLKIRINVFGTNQQFFYPHGRITLSNYLDKAYNIIINGNTSLSYFNFNENSSVQIATDENFNTDGIKEITYDLSNVIGEYYLVFSAYVERINFNVAYHNSIGYEILNVWMEKQL